MMHVFSADPATFAQQWEQDVPAVVTTAPCTYEIGDTLKLYETTAGVATGRYILSTVTGITPISDHFVTVYQATFQRAVQ